MKGAHGRVRNGFREPGVLIYRLDRIFRLYRGTCFVFRSKLSKNQVSDDSDVLFNRGLSSRILLVINNGVARVSSPYQMYFSRPSYREDSNISSTTHPRRQVDFRVKPLLKEGLREYTDN